MLTRRRFVRTGAAAAVAGVAAVAALETGVIPGLATVDGGTDSYWHRRADGNDPGFMLGEEFLPLLAARGLNTSGTRSSAGRWAGTVPSSRLPCGTGSGGQQAGLHTPGYWRRMLPDQLRFLGTKLGR